MQMIKFIHCADLHLDSPFKSKSHLSSKIFEDVQKSAYESFKKNCRYCFKRRS